MCLSYTSSSTCPECRVLIRRTTARVPCWNGALSPWRVHRNGLSCRSDRYDRGPDQTTLDELCPGCSCRTLPVPAPAPAPAPAAVYTYRHGYMTADGSRGTTVRSRRHSTSSTASLIPTSVSRSACAGTTARHARSPNAWAGCAQVQIEGPRTRWCH
jgi:hypothetical protein